MNSGVDTTDVYRGLFPDGTDVVEVTSFDDALAILRSADFLVAFGANSPRVRVDEGAQIRLAEADGAEDPGKKWTEFFNAHEVHFMRGAAHAHRRRSLAPLFGRDAHIWARDKVIVPMLRRHLDEVLAHPSADGNPRVDIVLFARRLFAQVAAGLIGLQGADSQEGTLTLLRIAEKLDAALAIVHDKVKATPEEAERTLRGAVDARDEFRRRFYEPSLEERQRLIALHREGKIGDDELPHDLLAVIASGVPTFEDPSAGVAQAGAFLSPLTSGTASTLVHAVADLIAWSEAHPEDRGMWANPSFLLGAISETIRLHETVVIPRLATNDVTLPSGATIRNGQYVAIAPLQTNRDVLVFGERAARYDPRRTVPAGVYPFGLGFGSGAHMCVAFPLVMGQGGISGLLAPMLRALFAIGVKPDPADPPVRRGGFPFRDLFAKYPVMFEGVGRLPDAAILVDA